MDDSQLLSAFQELSRPQRPVAPPRPEMVFDACQLGVVLRAVLFVEAVMAVGALFLAFNLAPTEEMLLLAVSMPAWTAALLMGISLLAMHAFVYGVAFRGRPDPQGRPNGWHLWLRFTIVGYGIALLLSAFMLWAFGRFDGASLAMGLQAVAVLGFPAAIGAAAARLIL